VNRGRCPDLNASADLTEIFDLSPEAVLYSVMRIAKAVMRIAKAVMRIAKAVMRIAKTGRSVLNGSAR